MVEFVAIAFKKGLKILESLSLTLSSREGKQSQNICLTSATVASPDPYPSNFLSLLLIRAN